MDIIGLQGERVRLVPPERSLHLDNCLRWLNDPRVTASLARVTGVSRREEEAFFDRIESDRSTFLVWMIHDESGRHIGMTHLALDWPTASASGGLTIGEPEAWGKGYATDAVTTRLRFAFDQLHLNRVEGHTFHPAMRRVYEKCGYAHEGTWRQKLWRDGRWHDAHFYAALASEWQGASSGGPRCA